MKIKDVIVETNSAQSQDVMAEGDSFAIELGDLIIETGVVGFTNDGVIVEADDKTMALLGLSGALLESVELDEVSLGDYHKKATMGKALAQMSAGFARSPEEREKNLGIAARREKGLARSKARGDKFWADKQAADTAAREQAIRDKYAGVDIDAEIAKLQPAIERAYHEYQYGARNTYSQGRDEYNSLKAKVQELERAKEILSKDVAEAKYQGREVPLGKPMQGDVKKSKVYVRGPKGNVVKVNFGDKNMKIKKSNPKRRKSFRARHNCANPGPRWKARYWSCRAW